MLHKIIGIGIGPFNLGLAALLSSHREIAGLFLERKQEFRWHEGLMIPGTTLQVPFLADLVSMADPTHKLSYLSYLHQRQRLYNFYFYERFQIPRQEFDDYCRWASQQLPSCQFGHSVEDVTYDYKTRSFVVETLASKGIRQQYQAQNIAVGVGTTPFIPVWAKNNGNHTVLHSSQYNRYRDQLSKMRHVTVVGSGQSAAECVLDLYRALTPEMISEGATIHWVSRAPGFFPMEYSKLGLEYFTPDYMRYFNSVAREKRKAITEKQGLLFKGISVSTIADIFDLLYERTIAGCKPGLSLIANCRVDDISAETHGNDLRVFVRNPDTGQREDYSTNAIILGTGYSHIWPEWFERFKETVIETDDDGHAVIDKSFVARRKDNARGNIFVQNAEIFHHGVGSPDLGLGSYRNGKIVNQLLGRTYYAEPENAAFQKFGLNRKHEGSCHT